MISEFGALGQEEAGIRFRPKSDATNSGTPPTAIVGEMLDRIDPTQIELMEVYQGPGIIPGEFLDDSCAVIVIWTRAGGRD